MNRQHLSVISKHTQGCEMMHMCRNIRAFVQEIRIVRIGIDQIKQLRNGDKKLTFVCMRYFTYFKSLKAEI